MEDKNILRGNAKDIRKNLKMSVISEKSVAMIRENQVYKNSQNVMIFYPAKHEVDLCELLSDGKNFYLPRVKGKELEVCPYKNGEELIKSEFGIWEPVTQAVDVHILDLVIVPALMCDRQGHRLGYGGGYYDRFLVKIPNVKTIATIPKELYAENLPHENHDIKIDFVLCL